MKWNLAIYLKGFPEHYRFRDQHYFMAPVTEEHVQLLKACAEKMPADKRFFENTPATALTVVAFCVEAKDQEEALVAALHQVEGIIDAISLVTDGALPNYCSLVEMREGDSPDSQIVHAAAPQWIFMESDNDEPAALWRDRNDKLFAAINPFLDIASGAHPRCGTPLCRQLLYSMKMFRWGRTVGDFGLEFVCKWSALEGLVCGGETSNKTQLLRSRIPLLFPNSINTKATVEKLWKFRHEAVHEARAFHSDKLHDSPPFAVEMDEVELFFRAVFVFALASVNTAATVKDLWSSTAGFSAPPEVLQQRPHAIARFPASNILLTSGFSIQGGGKLFDLAFAQHHASLNASHGTPGT